MKYLTWAVICASLLDLAITTTAISSALATELNPLAGAPLYIAVLKLAFLVMTLILGYRAFSDERVPRLALTSALAFYVLVCGWNTLQVGLT